MFNYKIIVQYNGEGFSGWQKQQGRQTIQEALESAVLEFSGEQTEVVGSGRTDAGVSAVGQVANFKLAKEYPVQKIVYAMNNYLPESISVLDCEIVAEDFNSRFSAKNKTYHYYFYTSNVRMPLLDKFALKCKPLNTEAMSQACKAVIGTHDFKSFVAARSGKTDFVRTITDCKIEHVQDNIYRLAVSGTGFLYNMVRIIMGTLIMIGEGKRELADMTKIIEAQDRTKAGKTVPPTGLVLAEVKYN